MSTLRSALTQALAALLMLTPWLPAGAVTVHVAGYSYTPFVTTSAIGVDDIELDAGGNVYQCSSGDIRRITPGGVAFPWSSATADDIAFASTGVAYGAGRAVCHCIVSISAGGSASTLHADSFEWTYIALGADGTLYSSILAGPGQGLYTIDRTTGSPSLVVNGGPGAGGSGFYRAMIAGLDGKLYACGFSSGTGAGVFRLDGNQLTNVATWPDGGVGLAQDNQGVFYTSLTVFRLDGSTAHEVWMYDPSTASATLLADVTGPSSAVAYDRARNFLYVQNGSSIYIIAKSPSPTRRETWSDVPPENDGSLKLE